MWRRATGRAAGAVRPGKARVGFYRGLPTSDAGRMPEKWRGDDGPGETGRLGPRRQWPGMKPGHHGRPGMKPGRPRRGFYSGAPPLRGFYRGFPTSLSGQGRPGHPARPGMKPSRTPGVFNEEFPDLCSRQRTGSRRVFIEGPPLGFYRGCPTSSNHTLPPAQGLLGGTPRSRVTFPVPWGVFGSPARRFLGRRPRQDDSGP